MQTILRQSQLRNFSTFNNTNKLTTIIQQTSNNIQQQQNYHYIKYQQLFFKLYASHLNKQKIVLSQIRKLDAFCIMSDFPCKSIVQHFHATSKIYNEQYVVQTFIRLSKAYKISQIDNSSTADYSINRLFFTPAFENLIEQFKYGLRKQNAMKWENAFIVGECLIDIGYVDYQVFSILINMVETRLNKKQRNQTEIRHFQIEKQNYYMGRLKNTQNNLIQDNQFNNVIKMLHQKVKSQEIKKLNSKRLKQLQIQLKNSQENINIYQTILQTVKNIQNYNNNLNKLIQGIITIRKQYRKMVILSQQKDILRNPQINFELLQLQETLLMKKLINLGDIKNSIRIQDQNLQLKRVQEVLVSLIENQNNANENQQNRQRSNIALSKGQISDFININPQTLQNKQLLKINKFKQISQYGKAMATLSRLAQVSRRLYNAPDGRSLISMKWQKTLIRNQKGQQQTDKQFLQNIHQQKIFRRTFVDLYRMMKRSYSIFMFTFIEAPLQYKIQFFESLTRLGFYQQLIKLFENSNNQDLSKEKVQNYSNNQFFSLVKILNQIGSKIHSAEGEVLKKNVLKEIKRKYQQAEFQENKSLFSMQFNINAINFICQNFNVITTDLSSSSLTHKQDTQILYQNLIDLLSTQIKYLEESQNYLINDHIYQAYRILSLQKRSEYKLNNNFYKRYGVNVQDKTEFERFLYKKNPFHFLVSQMCQAYVPAALNNQNGLPFIPTGFISTPKDNLTLTGILLCSSDNSSINGKHPNGNTNALITRIKRQFQVQITPLMTNHFLQIDYDKQFQNKQFQFKSKQQISQIMNRMFKKDQLHLRSFTKILITISSTLQKHYKKSYLLSVTKFLNTLSQCIILYERQKQILSEGLFKFKRYRLFVMLDMLKQDFNLIDKVVKQEIDRYYKKEKENGDLKKFTGGVLEAIEAIQKIILANIGTNSEQVKSLFTKNSFQGKRFTIQSFIQQTLSSQQLSNQHQNGIQFLNPTIYNNKSFCPSSYKQWSFLIHKYYPLQSINVEKSSNLTKILTKKYLPYNNNQLTLVPYNKLSLLKNQTEFVETSLGSVIKTQSQDNNNNIQGQQQKQAQMIKELFSFIHQLKITKNQNQLIQYIFSFDFINQLYSSNKNYNTNNNNNNNSQNTKFSRNAQQYFNQLQSKHTSSYLQSPNLSYLFSKLQKNQHISQLYSKRKQSRSSIHIKYQLGQLNRKQFYQELQKIDQQIIQALEGLNQNVLDNVDQYKFLNSGLKMVKIQKNQEELYRVLMNKSKVYERILDKDYIYCKGNVQKCMKIKRNKAQRLLALYNILYKLSSNNKPQQLSNPQKQFLKKQIQLITYRLDRKKQHNDNLNQKYTNLTINDLSKQDKQKLKLNGTNLTTIKNLPLTELIIELVNLLDSKVLENFEKLIYTKYYSSKHNIPKEVFISYLNKQFSLLVNKQQKAIINEHSKLNQYQKNILQQMIKTFKTQSVTGRARFSQFYDTYNQDINQMNQSQARVQLISQYLNLKQLEFQQDYNPKLVEQTKQRQVMKLWKSIFKKSYNQCTGETIRNVVEMLCDRLRIIGNSSNTPPFLGLLVLKILAHPETDILTKQNLISCLQYYKTSLKLDSQDIRMLGYECSNQQRLKNENSQELIKRMSIISNKNFMENINKKINMIL